MEYKGFQIIYDPPPIPNRHFDFEIHHPDLEPEDQLPRCGSEKECKDEIDRYYEQR